MHDFFPFGGADALYLTHPMLNQGDDPVSWQEEHLALTDRLYSSQTAYELVLILALTYVT